MVFLIASSKFTVTSSSFVDNTAARARSSVFFTRTKYPTRTSSNVASLFFFFQSGGVATVYLSSEFSATNSSFEHNTATDVPRSVFAQMGPFEFLPIDSTDLCLCSSSEDALSQNGGVALVQLSSVFSVLDSSFVRNSAVSASSSVLRNGI